MAKRKLQLAIDPGYDQFKITLKFDNTVAFFSFPSTIIRTNGSHEGLGKRAGNFYFYPGDGRIYLFGEAAENALRSSDTVNANRDLLEINKSSERFQSIYFKFALEAAIAQCLYLFQKSEEGEESGFSREDLEDYSITIGIALPHDALKDDRTTVLEYIRSKHEFKFQVAGDMSEPEECHYDFSKIGVGANSQAVCAFLSFALSDNATTLEGVYHHLPCVVYDAGYRTVGRFAIDTNLDISRGESNTDFAMYNVYQLVASKVNEQISSRTFEPYRVQKYLQDNMTVNADQKRIDLQPLYDESLKEVCQEAWNELNKNWKNALEDSRTFLLAGGTGDAYFKTFKREMATNYPYIDLILANKDFCGKKIEPIFAISVGLMKFLHLHIN